MLKTVNKCCIQIADVSIFYGVNLTNKLQSNVPVQP